MSKPTNSEGRELRERMEEQEVVEWPESFRFGAGDDVIAHSDEFRALIAQREQEAYQRGREEALRQYLLSVPVDSPDYAYIKSGVEREIALYANPNTTGGENE